MRVKAEGTWATSVLDATREELVEAGARAAIGIQRLGVRSTDADAAELKRRMHELADEFAGRDSPEGRPISILLLAHRRRA